MDNCTTQIKVNGSLYFIPCELIWMCWINCHSFRYTKCIAITMVRATDRYIRRSKVTAHRISVQRPQWEDGAGINLFR